MEEMSLEGVVVQEDMRGFYKDLTKERFYIENENMSEKDIPPTTGISAKCDNRAPWLGFFTK
ncbi:hypothetical protein EG329_005470 [Mollisiaceae sp. DMI_Dod_QoI]|nr:hypothetical protein EG329_005470 [Helotiales sp. DMI_Dod_QoI]